MRELLDKHGSFKEVELKLQRWKKNTHVDGKAGRWVTRKYLEEKYLYSKTMIDNSFNHARAKGLVRINPVHKEEEARLVLDETFNQEREIGECSAFEASGMVEAR